MIRLLKNEYLVLQTGRFPDAAASDTDDNCSVTSDTSEGSLPRPPVSGVAKSQVCTLHLYSTVNVCPNSALENTFR